jgi:uncharacterized protein DUF4440
VSALLAGLLLAGLGAVARPLPAAATVPAIGSRAFQSADARALLKLEDEWAAGLVKRDGALFRRLLAPGFVYTEDDRLSTRDEVLKDIISATDTVEAAHNEDMKVHSFGGTAVVTGWLIVKGHTDAGRYEHRYRFTDTWMRRNGGWQIIAAQDYLVPATRG